MNKDHPSSKNQTPPTLGDVAQFLAEAPILIAHSRTLYELRDQLSKAVWIIQNVAPETGVKEIGDTFECVLRVEITSDAPNKVDSFRRELCNLILDAPSANNADVMVTIHGASGPLPVFETNRKPSAVETSAPHASGPVAHNVVSRMSGYVAGAAMVETHLSRDGNAIHDGAIGDCAKCIENGKGD